MATPLKKVVLCISGSIAAYKSVHLLRLLQKNGYEVRIVMTEAASKFVAPLTFETFTKHPVYLNEFDAGGYQIGHIELARWAELVIIAPASANTIGKLACGLADNFMGSFLLAVTSPIMVFPAMNSNMYNNQAVQDNIKLLKARGMKIFEPNEGLLACGDEAKGKMLEPEEIFDEVKKISSEGSNYAGIKIVITAGPTVEPIDPVRFISNNSSGKMGYALAKIAWVKGADVKLISGPVHLQKPVNDLVMVNTASDMLKAVTENVGDADILIMAAAVADYTPAQKAEQKIKKNDEDLNITLKKTADILKTVSEKKGKRQVFVGFAAESEDFEKNALKKLEAKKLDFIVANNILRQDIGFNADDNEVDIYFSDGSSKNIGKRSKLEVAEIILNYAVDIWRKKR